MEAVEAFIASMLTMERWPFWAVVLVFTIVGQFTTMRLFTRERAYAKGRWQNFWWWGRESLPVHPVFVGILTGLIWRNPENANPAWSWQASCAYFAAAGAVSVFAWVIVKGIAKKKGYDLTLPGDSDNPPAP